MDPLRCLQAGNGIKSVVPKLGLILHISSYTIAREFVNFNKQLG